MKKTRLMLQVFLLLLSFAGCTAPSGENTTTPPPGGNTTTPPPGENKVAPMIPVYGINSGTRVLYGGTDTAGELAFTLLTPVLMGFKENSGHLESGDTIQYNILGETLTVTLNYDADTQVAVMNGTFSDGVSYTNMTVRYADNTFDYEQYIVVENDPVKPPAMPIGGSAIIYYNYKNVAIDQHGGYHTYQEGYSLQPGNTSVIESDIVCGEYNGKKISGAYVYKFKTADPQPDLSGISDFKTVTKEAFLAYFAGNEGWTNDANDHSKNTWVYYDYTDKILYGDALVASFFHLTPASLPWTLLPRQ